jgi:hypothetical protein
MAMTQGSSCGSPLTAPRRKAAEVRWAQDVPVLVEFHGQLQHAAPCLSRKVGDAFRSGARAGSSGGSLRSDWRLQAVCAVQHCVAVLVQQRLQATALRSIFAAPAAAKVRLAERAA